MSTRRTVLKWLPVMTFDMPAGHVVITVETQGDVPCMWTLGPDCAEPSTRREFVAFGTGHPIDDEDLVYVGTAHDIAGALVFHIFERPPL